MMRIAKNWRMAIPTYNTTHSFNPKPLRVLVNLTVKVSFLWHPFRLSNKGRVGINIFQWSGCGIFQNNHHYICTSQVVGGWKPRPSSLLHSQAVCPPPPINPVFFYLLLLLPPVPPPLTPHAQILQQCSPDSTTPTHQQAPLPPARWHLS